MAEPEVASLRSSDWERLHTCFFPLVPVSVNSGYWEHSTTITGLVCILHSEDSRTPTLRVIVPRLAPQLSLQ